jgi:beta-ureidopropionase / N-carbamoyl-L-amino-acid hydrolase
MFQSAAKPTALKHLLSANQQAWSAFQAIGQAEAFKTLAGLYEHSDWIIEQAFQAVPLSQLASPAALKHQLVQVVTNAPQEAQLALIRAHPPLSAKAKIDESIAKDSQSEQSLVGLDRCSPQEFAALTELNAKYLKKFGWPFILAVRGPRGSGLSRSAIIQALARRINMPAEEELQECLRQIHRIAEMRLDERLGLSQDLGHAVWDACEDLAQFTEIPGELTVTYMTPAHRQAAQWIADQMQSAGFDEVFEDAVGNVVGRYKADPLASGFAGKTLMTGSHYDTVRNGGKYDGRIGILIPIEVVRAMSSVGQRLPFDLEVIGFSEEEGVRFKCTFLGSSGVAGRFDQATLDATDGSGLRLADLLKEQGRALDSAALQAMARHPENYLGFVEVHIEQGPVLTRAGIPLGLVTSINGSARYMVQITGLASHAGTTPMGSRRDAAAAAAEFMVALERAATGLKDCVATVGQLQVVNGSTNVVPGHVSLSLDLRAPTNDQRDRLVHSAMALLESICNKRGVSYSVEQTLLASAAPSDVGLASAWRRAIESTGLPVYALPSGAGHDAMKLHEVMRQAMLFVRGENLGISHNPLESSTSHDLQLGCEAFIHLLDQLAASQTSKA